MSNYPDSVSPADPSAPWNAPEADINDDEPKVFKVLVTLYIEASNEEEMEDALAGVIQGGVVDYDDAKVMDWSYK